VTRIAVVIPVGPEEHHAAYLIEALQSVEAQTRVPEVLVIVDDMHGGLKADGYETVIVYEPPWRLGVGHAFNAGVAVATSPKLGDCELALMMGADDRLEPRVLEYLVAAYERQHAEGFYWLDVIYSDGEEQGLPCNAAAFTRGWFRESGGLPIEASAGGMDAALVSAMLVHRSGLLHHVDGPEGRYWVRRHAQQEGARLNAYAAAMVPIRNTFTELWQPTTWGRYD
jgi:glycosyltransferase involved in cell wall biosynthesis